MAYEFNNDIPVGNVPVEEKLTDDEIDEKIDEAWEAPINDVPITTPLIIPKTKKPKKKRNWSVKKFKLESKPTINVDLNVKDYFTPYAFVWLIFIIARMLLGATVSIAYIVAGFVTFLIVDPNIGKVLMPEYHRWWFTHSILLPLSIYWGLHSYLIMGDITKEFGILLMLPVAVHLVRDFWEDMENDKWSIKMYPLPLDLGKHGTIVWTFLNVIGMCVYMAMLMI